MVLVEEIDLLTAKENLEVDDVIVDDALVEDVASC